MCVLARMCLTEPITDTVLPGIDNLRYDAVGIHKLIGLCGRPHPFPTDAIHGKAIVDDQCIYSVPTEELNCG